MNIKQINNKKEQPFSCSFFGSLFM